MPSKPCSQACLLAVAVALAMAACGDPPPSQYPAQHVYTEDTTLGPGDIFDVRVFRQADMTGTYSVSSEGTISFPLVGEIAVGGKSPAEVERVLRERLLADGYLRDPQVSVLVKEYNSKKISVFGQVRKPGTFSFSAGMTITDAVAQAGGFADLARKNGVTVTRVIAGAKTNYTVPVESIGQGQANNFYIRPGDTIFVPRRSW